MATKNTFHQSFVTILSTSGLYTTQKKKINRLQKPRVSNFLYLRQLTIVLMATTIIFYLSCFSQVSNSPWTKRNSNHDAKFNVTHHSSYMTFAKCYVGGQIFLAIDMKLHMSNLKTNESDAKSKYILRGKKKPLNGGWSSIKQYNTNFTPWLEIETSFTS